MNKPQDSTSRHEKKEFHYWHLSRTAVCMHLWFAMDFWFYLSVFTFRKQKGLYQLCRHRQTLTFSELALALAKLVNVDHVTEARTKSNSKRLVNFTEE